MSIKNYKLKIKNNRGQLALKILIGFVVLFLVFGVLAKTSSALIVPVDPEAQKKALEIIQAQYDPSADPTTKTGDMGVAGMKVEPLWSLPGILAKIGEVFLRLVGYILLLAGGLFDYAVHLSLKGSTYGNGVEFVKAGWTLTRDFANLFFIIIILWLAISLILQINTAGAKKALARLILVALVINFSLILVQVVIDFSNVVAFEFYKQIGASTDKETGVKNLSATFASGLSPELIFGELQAGQGEDKILPRIFIATIMGAIIIFIAAFVLLAGAYFFLARIISLWFVMILAPIVFLFYIGGIGKEGKGYVNRWQKSLISNAFFAPAFLFFFWLVVMIIKNPIAGLETPQNPFGELLSDPTNKGGALAGALDEASKQTATTPLTLFLFKYFLLIALLTACLRVAKETGMYGADTVTKWGGKARSWATGFAARHTVGRAAEAAAEGMKGLAARHRTFGGAALKAAKWVSKKTGLEKVRESDVALAMSLSPNQQARFIAGAPKPVQKGYFDKASDRQIAEMYERAPDNLKPKLARLISRLPEAKKEKVYESRARAALDRDNKTVLETFEDARQKFEQAEKTGDAAAKKGEEVIMKKIISDIKKERLPSLLNEVGANKETEKEKEMAKKQFVQRVEQLGEGLDAKIFKSNPALLKYSEKASAWLKDFKEAPDIKDKQKAEKEIIQLMAEQIKKGVDIENVDAKLSKDEQFVQALARGLQAGNIEKLKDRGGELYEKYMDALKKLPRIMNPDDEDIKEIEDDLDKVVAALRHTDNKNENAARYFEGHLAPKLFGLTRKAEAPPQRPVEPIVVTEPRPRERIIGEEIQQKGGRLKSAGEIATEKTRPYDIEVVKRGTVRETITEEQIMEKREKEKKKTTPPPPEGAD